MTLPEDDPSFIMSESRVYATIRELRAENKRLKAEVISLKSSRCGSIHPIPEGDNQVVRTCARKLGHNGPHVDRDGSVWLTE